MTEALFQYFVSLHQLYVIEPFPWILLASFQSSESYAGFCFTIIQINL